MEIPQVIVACLYLKTSSPDGEEVFLCREPHVG